MIKRKTCKDLSFCTGFLQPDPVLCACVPVFFVFLCFDTTVSLVLGCKDGSSIGGVCVLKDSYRKSEI